MAKKKAANSEVFIKQDLSLPIKLKEYKWTEKQKEFIKLAQDEKTKLIFLSAPAGVGKTLISFYVALKLLAEGKVEQILYSRPTIESCDSSLKIGYLKGDLDSKIEPYIQPALEKLDSLVGRHVSTELINEEYISFPLVNFARGREWSNIITIFDECQDFSLSELTTLLTRIGENSKVIFCADPQQSDLRNGKRGAFNQFFKLFDDNESKSNGIHTFEFNEEDIMRSKLCKFIISRINKVQNV